MRRAAGHTFEEIALLFANGFETAQARVEGGRVVVEFCDPDGQATALLRQHRGPGIEVNSAKFERGLRQAKEVIFRCRDGAGSLREGGRR